MTLQPFDDVIRLKRTMDMQFGRVDDRTDEEVRCSLIELDNSRRRRGLGKRKASSEVREIEREGYGAERRGKKFSSVSKDGVGSGAGGGASVFGGVDDARLGEQVLAYGLAGVLSDSAQAIPPSGTSASPSVEVRPEVRTASQVALAQSNPQIEPNNANTPSSIRNEIPNSTAGLGVDLPANLKPAEMMTYDELKRVFEGCFEEDSLGGIGNFNTWNMGNASASGNTDGLRSTLTMPGVVMTSGVEVQSDGRVAYQAYLAQSNQHVQSNSADTSSIPKEISNTTAGVDLRTKRKRAEMEMDGSVHAGGSGNTSENLGVDTNTNALTTTVTKPGTMMTHAEWEAYFNSFMKDGPDHEHERPLQLARTDFSAVDGAPERIPDWISGVSRSKSMGVGAPVSSEILQAKDPGFDGRVHFDPVDVSLDGGRIVNSTATAVGVGPIPPTLTPAPTGAGRVEGGVKSYIAANVRGEGSTNTEKPVNYSSGLAERASVDMAASMMANGYGAGARYGMRNANVDVRGGRSTITEKPESYYAALAEMARMGLASASASINGDGAGAPHGRSNASVVYAMAPVLRAETAVRSTNRDFIDTRRVGGGGVTVTDGRGRGGGEGVLVMRGGGNSKTIGLVRTSSSLIPPSIGSSNYEKTKLNTVSRHGVLDLRKLFPFFTDEEIREFRGGFFVDLDVDVDPVLSVPKSLGTGYMGDVELQRGVDRIGGTELRRGIPVGVPTGVFGKPPNSGASGLGSSSKLPKGPSQLSQKQPKPSSNRPDVKRHAHSKQGDISSGSGQPTQKPPVQNLPPNRPNSNPNTKRHANSKLGDIDILSESTDDSYSSSDSYDSDAEDKKFEAEREVEKVRMGRIMEGLRVYKEARMRAEREEKERRSANLGRGGSASASGLVLKSPEPSLGRSGEVEFARRLDERLRGVGKRVDASKSMGDLGVSSSSLSSRVLPKNLSSKDGGLKSNKLDKWDDFELSDWESSDISDTSEEDPELEEFMKGLGGDEDDLELSDSLSSSSSSEEEDSIDNEDDLELSDSESSSDESIDIDAEIAKLSSRFSGEGKAKGGRISGAGGSGQAPKAPENPIPVVANFGTDASVPSTSITSTTSTSTNVKQGLNLDDSRSINTVVDAELAKYGKRTRAFLSKSKSRILGSQNSVLENKASGNVSSTSTSTDDMRGMDGIEKGGAGSVGSVDVNADGAGRVALVHSAAGASDGGAVLSSQGGVAVVVAAS